MERHASAQWNGPLKEGRGSIALQSGVMRDVPYGFAARFGAQAGTNPEELVAASHAACFSMALSAELGRSQIQAQEIRTDATVKLEQQGEGWSVTESHLDLFARAPGAPRETVERAIQSAKANCPISKALRIPITLKTELET